MFHDTGFYHSLARTQVESELRAKEQEFTTRGLMYFVVKELVRTFSSGRIPRAIELGGGYGTSLAILKRHIEIAEAISIDLVSPPQPVGGVTYLKGPIENLVTNIERDSVDLVLMLEVIEHLVDPDAVIEQVHRILKPGGVLLITTPNLSSLSNRLMLLAGYLPFGLEVSTKRAFGRPTNEGKVVGHLRLFTFKSLIEFMSYYGFVVREVYTIPEIRPANGHLSVVALNVIERLSRIRKNWAFRIIAVTGKHQC